MVERRGQVREKFSPREAEARLRRVLLHERSLDYADRAVMGGLDGLLRSFGMLIPWLGSSFPQNTGRYAALGPGQREMWVENVLHRLDSHSSQAPPKVEPDRRRGTRSTAKKAANGTSAAHRTATKPKASTQTVVSKPPESLATPVAELHFIAKTTRDRLAGADVTTLKDPLWFFPRRHIDYSKPTDIGALEYGQETTVIGHVVRAEKLSIGRNGAARVLISDGSGLATATFFSQPYLANRLKPGTNIAISGKINEFRGQAQIENPEYEVIERRDEALTHAGNLLPVYPSPNGIPQRTLRNAARKALDIGLPLVEDLLPADVIERQRLPEARQAVSDMHFPPSVSAAEAARRRLAFDELFLNQLLVLRSRRNWQSRTGSPHIASGQAVANAFLETLDFTLTGDQRSTLASLLDEMASGIPMARLLQGEVGSGKTVVALSALLACAANGFQGAFLAPTEVLAEQHYLSTSRQLGAEANPLLPSTVARAILPAIEERQVTVGLLTGSQSPAHKSKMHELIAAGEIDILIGTHALLQDAVDIPKLALAVVDEQHRFGVEQRAALGNRDPRPHMLAMSATPIPRTLALTVYGDLEISTLKQMPSGRSPLRTTWATDEMARQQAYEHLRSEVRESRQAFIVCPLIDLSDAVPARAAVPEFERLSTGPLSDLELGLLHGRMSITEKQAAMERFRAGDTQVLVATPVIEVGVDVPNATVMMVESADRFGLAQLHQLRGRVGRGDHAGTCYLLSDGPSEDAIVRLRTVEATVDGFTLADKDLELRGPGEYTGTRQSGWASMKIARASDIDLIEACRDEASRLLAVDPELSSQDHALLAAELESFAVGRSGELA